MHRGRTLSAATAAHLGTLVLDDLQPGDKLPPERTLAEDLAVSRTTIREALQELERRRLVSRCLLYTSPSPRDKRQSRMPSSA